MCTLMEDSRSSRTMNNIKRWGGSQNPGEKYNSLLCRHGIVPYVPTWFSIKKYRESIIFGSRNFYGLVKRTQRLDEQSKEIVCPVIQHICMTGHTDLPTPNACCCPWSSTLKRTSENVFFLRIMKAHTEQRWQSFRKTILRTGVKFWGSMLWRHDILGNNVPPW